VGKVGLREDVTISGGVGKNIGVVKAIERRLGMEMKNLPGDSQIVGALGAALIAQEICLKC